MGWSAVIHVTGKALAGISIFPLGNSKFTPTVRVFFSKAFLRIIATNCIS
jgi:hypothetical protein